MSLSFDRLRGGGGGGGGGNDDDDTDAFPTSQNALHVHNQTSHFILS